MRALHELAALLGCTVGMLLASGMSWQEFARWRVWMAAEQQGPRWQALHRAELLAAVHNGSQFVRRDKRPHAAADFLPPDPWVAKAAATAAAPDLAHDAEAQQREFDAAMQAWGV